MTQIVPHITRPKQPFFHELVYAKPKENPLALAVAFAIKTVGSLPQPIPLGYVQVALRWWKEGDQWRVEKVQPA